MLHMTFSFAFEFCTYRCHLSNCPGPGVCLPVRLPFGKRQSIRNRVDTWLDLNAMPCGVCPVGYDQETWIWSRHTPPMGDSHAFPGPIAPLACTATRPGGDLKATTNIHE